MLKATPHPSPGHPFPALGKSQSPAGSSPHQPHLVGFLGSQQYINTALATKHPDPGAVPPSKHNAPAGVAAQLPTSPGDGQASLDHHSPDPRPSCPKITYTSAFATCVGGELVPGWKRCGGSVLGLASRSQPQPQPLLLRSIVLPSLPALPDSSQLVCIFRAAWGAGHGSRWGFLVPALGDEEGSRRLPQQTASRWQWGFCARARGPRRAALCSSAGSPPPSAGHHGHCGWTG